MSMRGYQSELNYAFSVRKHCMSNQTAHFWLFGSADNLAPPTNVPLPTHTNFQRALSHSLSFNLSLPFRWKLSAISTWPSLGCQTIVRITPSAWLVLLWTWWTWPRTLRWAPIQWWVQLPYSFFTFSQLLVIICLVKGLRLWDTM